MSKLDLMDIFEDFVKNYRSFRLTYAPVLSSFTLKELNYFYDLGYDLGYYSFTEDRAGGDARQMDLAWWDDWRGGVFNDLVLHLERENNYNKAKETLEKLFQTGRKFPPTNAIGLIPVRSKLRITELIKIAQQTCNVDNTLLVFRVGPSANNREERIAYVLQRRAVTNQKTAYVTEDPKTGFLSMSF
jgi:hypothetical protein